ncbi:MAG: amino acid permease [Candidatus Eisenbacteria bacterium]|nr:amino acid permease [Candidatus Eisenbacteria bacterium]
MKRQLGFFAVFSIASGAMISSGLFILPGLAFERAGPAVFLSYALAGLLAVTAVFSLAELTTAMPRSGGDYFFITRSFGSLLGSVSGLLSWLALSLKSAFAIIGIAELLALSFGFNLILTSLLLCVFFVLLNLLGVREASRFQSALVAALLAILFWLIASGLSHIELSRFEPFLPHGGNALVSTAGFVFVSFGGLLTTASLAGEVRDPKRNLPRGLIASVLVVTGVYALVTFVAVGALPAPELARSLTPVADSAAAILGRPGFVILTIASLLAFVTTANGGILTASRYPAALARDNLLPARVARLNRRSGVPTPAVLLTGVFIALSLLLRLDVLVKAASTVVLLTSILASLSLIVLRESRLSNYRPSFRAPLYPWLQILSIVAFAALILDMGLRPTLYALLFVLSGVALYFGYGRRRARTESAMLHLLERITNRKLTSRSLQRELREIVHERDNITPDSFDEVVKRAQVLDIEEQMGKEEFFRLAAEHLSCGGSCPSDIDLVRLLDEREAESSTAITPFAAVPHIVLEGDGVFDLLLVRARKGVRFSESARAVKAVFLLVGTRDTRTLHLRALAAIAQTLQSDGFEKRWLDAKGERDLVDVMLLSDRPRMRTSAEE